MKPRVIAAEHLEESEINRILKYLQKRGKWKYYILIRLGISTALRYSDLSRIKWSDVLSKDVLTIKEKKTGKVRQIPIQQELSETLSFVYEKMKCPDPEQSVITLHIRTVNKQLKVYAKQSGVIRPLRFSSHSLRKSFARAVWMKHGRSEEALVKLSHLFNHSSTAITRIYLSITKEEVDDLYDIQDLFVY
jgi:integrase